MSEQCQPYNLMTQASALSSAKAELKSFSGKKLDEWRSQWFAAFTLWYFYLKAGQREYRQLRLLLSDISKKHIWLHSLTILRAMRSLKRLWSIFWILISHYSAGLFSSTEYFSIFELIVLVLEPPILLFCFTQNSKILHFNENLFYFLFKKALKSRFMLLPQRQAEDRLS